MEREPDSCPGCGSMAFKTIWGFYSSTYKGFFNRCASCDGYSIWHGDAETMVGENFALTPEQSAFVMNIHEKLPSVESWVARAKTHKFALQQKWGDLYNHVENVPIEVWISEVVS